MSRLGLARARCSSEHTHHECHLAVVWATLVRYHLSFHYHLQAKSVSPEHPSLAASLLRSILTMPTKAFNYSLDKAGIEECETTISSMDIGVNSPS